MLQSFGHGLNAHGLTRQKEQRNCRRVGAATLEPVEILVKMQSYPV
jgi:hypothetical protein